MAIEVTSEHEKPRLRAIRKAGRIRGLHPYPCPPDKFRLKTVLRYTAASLLFAIISLIAVLVYSYYSYSQVVDERLAHGYLTSRAGIYAAPRTLRVGQTLSRDELIAHLRRAGYIETNASEVWSGSFRALDQHTVEIR